MSKWSWFFLLVPIGGVAIFAIAPSVGWSLPENVSSFGEQIDSLYYGILAITGLTFIGTNAALCYILWRFGQDKGGKAHYMHGSRNLEVIWTVIPAVVLLFIALYQMPAWIDVRFPESKPPIDPIARVVARQFEWRMIYPGPDGVYDTPDDLHVPNELHMHKDARTLIDLRSMDVLHSFFLPNLRVKQDAVPGLAIPVWFDAKKSTREYQAESALLTRQDLVFPADFLDALQAGKDPVSAHLKSLLPAGVDRELEDWNPEYDPDESLVLAVIDAINQAMPKESFHTPERFANVALTQETKDELAIAPPAGPMMALLNRRLLDDAYPLDIKKLDKQFELVCAELCGWGHYKMKGRVVVHETREDFQSWVSRQTAEQEASK